MPSLQWHQGAADVAQDKCRDMAARQYSSHPMPAGYCYQGRSPCWSTQLYIWDVLAAIGYPWRYVAENLWLSGDLRDELAETANTVFMGSPGHRAGMLEPVFTHVGIGITFDPRWNGCHVSELFLTPS